MTAEPEFYDGDTEMGDASCPKCNGPTRSRQCMSCEDGFSELDHDCGEDTCCCLDPEPGRIQNPPGEGDCLQLYGLWV